MTENAIVVKSVSRGNYEDAVVHLTDKYVRFYEFGLTVAGVQFIGLTFEMKETDILIERISYFLLAMCCLFSLFGSTMAYLMVKYLGSVRFEDPEFFVEGMRRYSRWFSFTEWVPYLSSTLFLITINLLVAAQSPLEYSVVFHVLSGVLTACMVVCQGMIIIAPKYTQPPPECN